jgi:hypothetical protein
LSDWQLDRLPGDVRLEAENAAQREGLPLHRWLGKLIRDTCAEEGVALSRELSRSVLNGAAAAQRRSQSATAEPPRAAPEPHAAEPLERPVATVAKSGNGIEPALNGYGPAGQVEPPRATNPSAPTTAEVASEPVVARRVAPAPVPDSAPPATPRFAPAAAAKPATTPAPAAAQPNRVAPGPTVVSQPKQETPAPAAAVSEQIRRGAAAIVMATRAKQESPPPATAPTPQPSRVVASEPIVVATRPKPEPPARSAPAAPQQIRPSLEATATRPKQESPTPAPTEDRQTVLTKLVQGLRRNELSPIGEARLYLKLMTEHAASIAELTVATGRTRDQITRSLRLLSLSDRLRELIDRGALSRDQAYALLDSDNPEATNPVVPPSAIGRPQ